MTERAKQLDIKVQVDMLKAKRILDLVITSCILICAFPLLAFVTILCWIIQGRPVFFVQSRIGRLGLPFDLYKFRTMSLEERITEHRITIGCDPRITPLGSILRKCKLDELPQLLNILKGDMSLVGPRPEVEEFVALYNQEQRRVLEIRPGLTDLASLKYFNEADLLGQSDNPKKLYIDSIMPDKIAINLKYIDDGCGIGTDIKIIAITALRVIGIKSRQRY